MNIWGGNILKRFSSSISRKMWSYLHIIKVVYCCRYFHLVNSVCICLIVSLIHIFLLLDVLVLFGIRFYRKMYTYFLEHFVCSIAESLLYFINQSYRVSYRVVYYMPNIRYYHLLIPRLRTTTKSNDLERSKSTIR